MFGPEGNRRGTAVDEGVRVTLGVFGPEGNRRGTAVDEGVTVTLSKRQTTLTVSSCFYFQEIGCT